MKKKKSSKTSSSRQTRRRKSDEVQQNGETNDRLGWRFDGLHEWCRSKDGLGAIADSDSDKLGYLKNNNVHYKCLKNRLCGSGDCAHE